MNRITSLLALAIAALALIAAGCGGDDETTTETGASGATGASGTPLSQSEFIAQADAICKTSGNAIDQAGNQLFGGQQPSEAQVQQFADDVLVPGLREQLDGLRALTPPEGDEDQVAAILDAADNATDQIEEDPSLLQASDNAGPFAEANQLAGEYGLEECGN